MVSQTAKISQELQNSPVGINHYHTTFLLFIQVIFVVIWGTFMEVHCRTRCQSALVFPVGCCSGLPVCSHESVCPAERRRLLARSRCRTREPWKTISVSTMCYPSSAIPPGTTYFQVHTYGGKGCLWTIAGGTWRGCSQKRSAVIAGLHAARNSWTRRIEMRTLRTCLRSAHQHYTTQGRQG